MKIKTMRVVALATSTLLFVSASASGLDTIAKSAAPWVEQALRGHPGTFTDKPLPPNLGPQPGREVETRGGVWSAEALATVCQKERTVDLCSPQGPPPPPSHTLAVDPAPGSTYPWEGQVGSSGSSVNTANGNKLTSLHLVSWPCRGGLSVDFTLFHNSETTYNDELGYGWSWTYDIYISVSGSTATVHWGDGLCVPFTTGTGGGGMGAEICSSEPEAFFADTVYTPPAGIYDSLVHHADGTWTLGKKNQMELTFNSSGFCNRIEDRNGNAITITLNAQNYATRVTDPCGRYYDIELDANNNFMSVTDPLGRSWSFTRNGSDDLSTVTWPALDGNTYSDQFSYTSHRITTQTDKRGKNRGATYNSDGSVATETDPLSHSTSYTYTSSYTDITDPLSHTRRDNYSSGKLASQVDPCNYSTSYTYNSSRNVTRVTDARGKYWDYTYDSMGNVLTRQDPLDHTWTYTYTSLNDVATATDPLSHVTTYTYTGGNLTSVSDPLSHETTLGYDSYGQCTSVTDALDHTTTLEYDTYGNLTSVTDPLSRETTATYDDLNRITSVTDPLSHTESVAYDAWDRPVTYTHDDDTAVTKTFSAEHQLLSITNELSKASTFAYDDAGRLTSVTNAKNEVQSYGYDNADRTVTVTNGRNKTRTYAYNNRGEVTSLTLPDNSVEQWSYNGNGDVTAYTNPLNQVIYYAFDDAGRMTGIDYPTGTDPTFSYDNANRTSSMVDSTGTTSWTYDNASRVTGLNTPQGNMTYTYDAANRRATMVESSGTTTYAYDAASQLTQLVNPYNETTSWTYDNAGRTTRNTLGNGAYTDYGWDSRNRITSTTQKKSDGTVISSESHVYDDASRMTSKTVDSVVTSYTYDDISQLTGESRTGYVCTYSYDANGNRLTKTLNDVTENYTYDDADKMLTAGSKSYTYDDAGRTTAVTSNNQTTTLSYDYESRLTQITYPNSTTNTFTYNALGARASEVGSGGSWVYKHDGVTATSPILSDGSATYTRTVSERRANVSTFFLGDYRNSITTETDALQRVTATRQYDAFGLLVVFTGTSGSPYGFAAGSGCIQPVAEDVVFAGKKCFDAATGASYTMARDGFESLGREGLEFLLGLPDFQGASDFFAGWGDELTAGGTKYARKWLGEALGVGDANDAVNYDSGSYFAGRCVGFIHQLALVKARGAKLIAPRDQQIPDFLTGDGVVIGNNMLQRVGPVAKYLKLATFEVGTCGKLLGWVKNLGWIVKQIYTKDFILDIGPVPFFKPKGPWYIMERVVTRVLCR